MARRGIGATFRAAFQRYPRWTRVFISGPVPQVAFYLPLDKTDQMDTQAESTERRCERFLERFPGYEISYLALIAALHRH